MVRAKHLLQSSIIVMALFALGKATGLVRARLLATTFGTGAEFDSFTAANQLPEVFFTVIAGGSLAAAFIPVYSKYLTDRGARKSAELSNTILTLVIMILGVISLLGAIFAPWLTRVVLVPDFPPEQQMLTAEIMRIILIQTMLFGVSGVLSSMLNAHQHFALPALAPVALDIGYMLGIFFLVPGMGIIGLAWGTVIGGVLHIMIQMPALVKYKLGYRPRLNLRLPGVGDIGRLMGPRIVALGTIQIADLFIIRLASGLPVGTTSGYFYGYALMQLPETLFGTAVALVVFPTLAELYNAGDIDGMKRTFSRTLSIIWTLTIPAAAGMVLLGRPVIDVLLGGGEFDQRSVSLVYAVLVVFSVRIVTESTLEMVARLFYAQHNTRTPMFAYLGWLVVMVGLAYGLVDTLGIVALALASTIAFSLLAIVLFMLNRHVLGSLDEPYLAKSGARALLATAGMSLLIWGVVQMVDGTLPTLLIGGLVGAVSYVGFNLLLGGREIPALISLVRK